MSENYKLSLTLIRKRVLFEILLSLKARLRENRAVLDKK